jgi:hypothetical protein
MCNGIKQHWTIQELGWAIRTVPRAETWDGLSGAYRKLFNQIRDQVDPRDMKYYDEWVRALDAASRMEDCPDVVAAK